MSANPNNAGDYCTTRPVRIIRQPKWPKPQPPPHEVRQRQVDRIMGWTCLLIGCGCIGVVLAWVEGWIR